MPQRKPTAVLIPNLGLYLDRPPLTVPDRGLQSGRNFRVRNGKIECRNLGWEAFGDFSALNGPVKLIDNFVLRSGGQILIFGTTLDLYKYVEGDGSVDFITPRYETATVDVSADTPAVVTTNTGTPAWDDNLKAGDQIYFGATGQTDPEATWYEIASVDSADQLTLTTAVVGGAQSNVAYTARQLFTMDITDRWETDVFYDAQPDDSDLWFATNGVDSIVKWDGSGDQVEVTSLTFTCKNLRVFRNMMVYINVTDSGGDQAPNSIINSDVTKPEDVSNGLASENVVKDGVDPLVAALRLGDNLMLYGERSAVLVQFVGDPLVLAFRTAISGRGPVAAGLVADFGDYHEFISTESHWRFDGLSLEERGGHVWRKVLRTRDPNRTDLSFHIFDEENGDLIWVVPLTSDMNTGDDQSPQSAYPEHYLERVGTTDPPPFSLRDFPFTSAGFFQRQTTLTWDQLTAAWETYDFAWNDSFYQAAFPFLLVGNEAGEVFTLGTTSTADGEDLTATLRFNRRVLGDGRQRNLLARIYPLVPPFPGNTAGLAVTTYLYDHPSNDTPARTDTQTFDLSLPEEGHFVSVHRRGRLAEIEFEAVAPWDLEGYDWDIKQGGSR